MPSVGQLVAFLSLDTAKFEDGVKRTDKLVGSLKQKINLLGSFEKSFKLESLAKAGLLVSSGVNAANIATKALSGNIQDAADAVKELPLGVGQMARALEDVMGQWSGINREIEVANQLTKTQNALADITVKTIEDQRKAIAGFAAGAAARSGEAALIGLEGSALASAREKQGYSGSMADIERRRKEAIATSNKGYAERGKVLRGTPITEGEIDQEIARRQSAGMTGNMGQMYRGGAGGPSREIIRQELQARQSQILAGTNEAQRVEAEAKINAAAYVEMEAEAKRHQKQMDQIDKDAARERYDALVKDGNERLTLAIEHNKKVIEENEKAWDEERKKVNRQEQLKRFMDKQQRDMAMSDIEDARKEAIDKARTHFAAMGAGTMSLEGARMATESAQRQAVEISGPALDVLRQILASIRSQSPVAVAG